MTIGERIKERRKYLGISVEQLGERLGKNRATIYRYESDEIENMPSNVLTPLANALGVTPAYLMGWEDSEEDKSHLDIVAAHNDGDDWTEEELEEIEEFKAFLKSRKEARLRASKIDG